MVTSIVDNDTVYVSRTILSVHNRELVLTVMRGNLDVCGVAFERV